MNKIRTIHTLFIIPSGSHTKSPCQEELALWTIRRKIVRHQYFGYLSDQDYLQLGNSKFQHVGLLSLCAVFREHGYDVRYFTPEEETIDDLLLQKIAACDMLLVSSYTYNLNVSIVYTRRLKELNPKMLIGIGGYHAPHVPEATLRTDNGQLFDFTMSGYTEKAILRIPIAYEHGGIEAFKRIPQIMYLDTEKGFQHNRNVDFPSLADLPLPANDLIPDFDLTAARVFSVYGCPFQCQMCNLGKQDSYSERPLSLFEQEIEYFVTEKRVKYIYVGDPTIGINLKRLKELVKIMNRFPTIKWGGQTRLSIAQQHEFRAILQDSECVHLEIGVETLSQKLLNTIRKDINAERSEDILYKLAENQKLHIQTNWIFGLPGADEKDILFDRAKILQLIHDGFDAGLSMCVPHPSSAMFDKPEQFGITIEETNWDEFPLYGKPVFSQIHGLTGAELFELYKETTMEMTKAFKKKYRDVLPETPVKDISLVPSYF
jgi:anaerobic magnesium-protoporphyrin IX monomethyl ester cyclase